MSSVIQTKERFWNDSSKRAIIYQVLVIGIIGMIGYYLFTNIQANLENQSIATGFSFLAKESSFEVTESLIPHSANHTYANALLVGVLNTLKVAFIGIVLTIVFGTFVGVARLSTNWLLAKLAAIYIEVMRNIPVLLQLFFWYTIFYENLPSPRQALSPAKGIFLCNRGLYLSALEPDSAYVYMALAFLTGCLAVFFLRRWALKRQEETGKFPPVFYVSLGILIGLPLITWLIAGAPFEMNTPRLKGFNFEGGMNISPEFSALLVGLVLYTAAFVAEIVRAGIQSVSQGQKEAAISLGLKPHRVLTLVVLPQALRVIIPPLTGQMLDLTKNSSLAVAIGYPDFVSMANTTINQTGQAIEGVGLIMVVFLSFSLLTSIFMNMYNKKIALIER